jgi:hypothetical protein
LCLYQQGCKVSKMILGNPHPQLTVCAYETIEEAIDLLSAYLVNLRNERSE